MSTRWGCHGTCNLYQTLDEVEEIMLIIIKLTEMSPTFMCDDTKHLQNTNVYWGNNIKLNICRKTMFTVVITASIHACMYACVFTHMNTYTHILFQSKSIAENLLFLTRNWDVHPGTPHRAQGHQMSFHQQWHPASINNDKT